jgi:UDP-N-acetylmuramyl pentapeptide synthase
MKGSAMKRKKPSTSDELRPEYEFDYSKADRGKYRKRLLAEGANLVVLEPDVAKAFRDSAAVNDTLRSLLDLARSTRRHAPASNERS